MSKTTKALAIMGVVAGLGVAALPMSTYAVADPVSKEAQVKLEVKDVLSLDLKSNNDSGSESEENLTVVNLGTATGDGNVVEGSLTATVKTNNKTGYIVTIQNKETETAMLNADSDKIPAGTPAKGTSAWGYKVSNIATGGTNSAAAVDSYVGVPANGTPTTIVNSNGPTKVDADNAENNGDTATVEFGASVSTAQAMGEYSSTVVLTASANIAG